MKNAVRDRKGEMRIENKTSGLDDTDYIQREREREREREKMRKR